MATWISHFRMAETLLEQGLNVEPAMFTFGNIAPDSGLLNRETLSYDPPKEITHWHDSPRLDFDICYEDFYQQHISGRDLLRDEFAFLLGYYCHLIADMEWNLQIWRPKLTTPTYFELLAQDPQAIWEIKKDWYGLDFLYLNEHPEHIFYTEILPLETISDYLDYFPKGAFAVRLDETKTFYAGQPDWDLDRPYIYLSREEWEQYITKTTQILGERLHEQIGRQSPEFIRGEG